ncbi:MAG: hypothetical protein M3438_04875 [Pseudomonadota bacterium]|nr:hypothetical protein [Sphingomonas sp.]MDQ3478475.1 hypothetical protein [Pseudomonadota bacterium]
MIVVEFAGYTFDDHKASFVCKHVLDGNPILLFIHEIDGDIHFMCGAAGHTMEDIALVGISHLLEHLRSIAELPIVDPGFLAERPEPGGDWEVQAIEP